MRSKRKIALPRVKNPRRLINWAQNALILLLVAGAVILAAGPSGFGVGTELRPEGAFAREEYVSPEYGAAAEPMCIVVTPEEGVHDAALYSSRDLSDAYRAYSAALAEALGSAGEPVKVDAAAWERAISSSGVYFDYYTDCQLSSFAIWLGSEMTSSAAAHTARRLCLALEDGSVALYYMRARQGTWYRCDTELNYSELAGRVAESGPDGASFIFEHDGKYEGVDPYWVIASGQTEVRTIAGEDSVSGSAERIMEAFGMNSMLAQGLLRGRRHAGLPRGRRDAAPRRGRDAALHPQLPARAERRALAERRGRAHARHTRGDRRPRERRRRAAAELHLLHRPRDGRLRAAL